MEGGGKKKKKNTQSGTSSGGAGEMREQPAIADGHSGRKIDKAVDPSTFQSANYARVMERQTVRSIPHRFRPPVPRQYDVSKKQSTNREVEEEGSRSNSTGESVSDSTHLTSSVSYGGRHHRPSSAPADPPREPTIDELFSGEANPDVAYRGDWWRGGLYY